MKTIKYLLLTSLVLFNLSCKETEKCGAIEKPKNLKAINWENYNDIYTVYWNYAGDCSNIDLTGEKTIKIEGWLLQPGGNITEINPEQFYITTKPNQFLIGEEIHINVRVDSKEVTDALRIKFENNDLTKKCYIKGRLLVLDFPMNYCCYSWPVIILEDENDIIFE
jgi:hypothetical protein